MRVLFLTNIPSPYRVDFFNGLAKNCELTVLFERDSATNRDPSWYGKNFEFDYHFLKSLKIKEESSLSLEMIRYFRQDYDLIIISGYSSLTAILSIVYLKFNKKNFVMVVDGANEVYKKNIKFYFKKFLISSASAWLSTGENVTNYLVYHGACRERIFKYPLASFFEKDFTELLNEEEKRKIREELGVTEQKLVIYVGRITPYKRVDLMLKSCASIDDVRICIIGGQENEELKRIRNENNIKNVTYINHANKETVKKFFMCADLFVFLSVGEIWGLVVAEAMSQSCLVLATDGCTAAKELILDEWNGFIIDQNIQNDKEINFKIKKILSESKHNDIIRKQAYQSVKDYTIENMVSENYNIFSYILENIINE